MDTGGQAVRTALRRIFYFICLSATIFISGVLPLAAQQGHAGAEAAQQHPVDVAVLVLPAGENSARVGIAYRTRVPHADVYRDMQRLQLSGWTVSGKISITDSSLHAKDVARFPTTTGAELTISGQPLLTPNGPALFGFLQALQRWTYVEVIFALPRDPSAPALHLDNGSVAIDQVAEEGMYRYEAKIVAHSGSLGQWRQPASALPHRSVVPAPAAGARPGAFPWPLLLIVGGSGLVVCGVLWLLVRHLTGSDRSSKRKAPG